MAPIVPPLLPSQHASNPTSARTGQPRRPGGLRRPHPVEAPCGPGWSATVARRPSLSPTAVPCVGDEVLLRADGDQIWLDSGAATAQRHHPGIGLARQQPAAGTRCQRRRAGHLRTVPSRAGRRTRRAPARARVGVRRPTRRGAHQGRPGRGPRIAPWPRCSALALGAPVRRGQRHQRRGLDDVRSLTTPGQALALLGPSGAGKSTLLNALLGVDAMATSHVRADGKGRHTTTHRELFVSTTARTSSTHRGSGASASRHRRLDQVFAEISELAESCRFSDCAHRPNPAVPCSRPSSAAPAAATARQLPQAAARGRLPGAARQRPPGGRGASAVWKSLHKQMRQPGRNRP